MSPMRPRGRSIPAIARRRHIYNLYHVLNHLNLFGGAYLHQAIALMDRLLRERAAQTGACAT